MRLRPHRARHGATLLLALLAASPLVVGASACGALEVPAETAAVVCTKSSQCGTEQICDLSYCRVDGDSDLELAARVFPPSDHGLLEQQVPAILMADGPALLLTLVEPAVMAGAVEFSGNDLVDSVPGTLEAVTEGDVAGLSYRFQVPSADALDDKDHGFELRLLPGRAYKVTFRPEDPGVPPYAFELTPEQVQTTELTIQLPAKKDYEVINGFVRLGQGASIAQAKVTVLLEDGTALPPIKTMDNGFFTRFLPPGTQAIRVRVQAPAQGPVFADWESAVLPIAPREGLPETVPSVSFDVPPPADGSSFEQAFVVSGADGEPAPGLVLTLLGTVDERSLVRTAVTDSEGVVVAELLEGSWQVRVSVPPAEPLASAVFALDLSADSAATTQHLDLALRPVLSGTIKDARQRPVAVGTLTAIRRTDTGIGFSIAPQPFNALIGAGGEFSLPLDPGVYDIRISPSASTGAPADVLFGLEVPEDTVKHFGLREPDLAHITVAAPDGTFLEDVTVELYIPSESGPPTLLTKGVTGGGGFVDLVVPFSD